MNSMKEDTRFPKWNGKYTKTDHIVGKRQYLYNYCSLTIMQQN